ncbi:Lipid A export ATP-binding/permease protein MsbA [Streptomyces sp. S4.7]|uniref:ATP-binding cassette domain-containing protein n=1 Tax=Streptomyces sp. S4.7 TaxID=2705439 RepID=UPI001397DEDD|nr:ABC transporter ATP-binding protein [Streptomyces sp. S4.7]QHY99718.1 Lipid A export ATP-binding/permease protein MsbA [Streptomyces sp. S4.7]
MSAAAKSPAGAEPPAAEVSSGRGALRRNLPPARRFLAGRKRALVRLGGWSLLESAQTFLGGYCLAQALDRGFLAGQTGTGLLWLAVAAASILGAGPPMRGVFAQLAELTEPLRDALVRRAVRQALRRAVTDPARTDDRSDTGAVSRLTHQTEIVRDSFAGLVLTVRAFVFNAVGALIGLLALAPELLLVVLPPLVLGIALFLATLLPMASAQRDFLDADEAVAEGVGAVSAGHRDLVACGAQADAAQRTGRLIDVAERTSRVLARWAALRTVALGVAGQLPVLLLLVTTPWLLRQGVTTGALAGALTYLLQALLPALHSMMTALGAAGTRLLVVVDRFQDATAAPLPTKAPAPDPAGAGRRRPSRGRRPSRTVPAVEVRDVTHAYGPDSTPVLERLDLTVRRGEHIAVVGPSGIGKSTLAGVVSGLVAPDEGTVLLGGEPVTGRTARDLADRRVLIPQQAYVFTGSVRDNLLHLRPDATSGELAHAIRTLGAEPLVHRLGGPDAALAPRGLSHGERQLLALCRAYLSAAPLVLLDEATCHLDPPAEARVERAFAERASADGARARDGALIVVAHRLSSARRADRVLVLDGTTPRFGTHEELLTSSALYRDLFGHWQHTPSPPVGR